MHNSVYSLRVPTRVTRASGRSPTGKRLDMRRIVMTRRWWPYCSRPSCHKPGSRRNRARGVHGLGSQPRGGTGPATPPWISRSTAGPPMRSGTAAGGGERGRTGRLADGPPEDAGSSAAFARRIRWLTTCAMPARPRSMKAAAEIVIGTDRPIGFGKHATGLECSTIASP